MCINSVRRRSEFEHFGLYLKSVGRTVFLGIGTDGLTAEPQREAPQNQVPVIQEAELSQRPRHASSH